MKKFEHQLMQKLTNVESIIGKNNKIDALILQLKLQHIYTLPDAEQCAYILKCYSWIDNGNGDIDQFQYKILQEVVSNMTNQGIYERTFTGFYVAPNHPNFFCEQHGFATML